MAYVQMLQQSRVALRRGAGVLGWATAILALAGCTQAVPRYQPGLFMGDQGTDHAVVFETETVIATVPQAVREHTWRDDSLAIRPAQSAYDQAAWPDIRRPSLDRPRRLYLHQHSSESYLYFREEGYQFSSNRQVYWRP